MNINGFLSQYEMEDLFQLEGYHEEDLAHYNIQDNETTEEKLVLLHNQSKMHFPSYLLRFGTLGNLEDIDEETLYVLLESGSYQGFEELQSRYNGSLKGASDEYLVIGAQLDGELEKERLTDVYNPIIERIINRVERRFYFRGLERDDLLQEAFIGYLKAIEVFKVERRTKFREFSRHVIERHLGTLMNRSKNLRNKALNESFSYNMPVNSNNETTFEDLLEGEAILPEDIFMKREMFDEIQKTLTDNEKEVLVYYSKGLTYQQIAEKTGRNKKSIDNTIQRIRGKGETYLVAQLIDEGYTQKIAVDTVRRWRGKAVTQ